MRKTMLMLAVFGLAGSLWAADAFVGTWKYDITKSKLAPNDKGAAAKESILVIGEIGASDRESYSKEVYTDGSSVMRKWTVPRQGGIVKYHQGDPKPYVCIVTRISGGEDYWTILQDGKQVEVSRWTVSKDGKTIRGEIKGTDAKGKPYEYLAVGDRQ